MPHVERQVVAPLLDDDDDPVRAAVETPSVAPFEVVEPESIEVELGIELPPESEPQPEIPTDRGDD